MKIKSEKLKEKLEELLEYEEDFVEQWENEILDAQGMVRDALKEDPKNKWLDTLYINLLRACSTEFALSDVKGLLSVINDQNESDKSVENYAENVEPSIELCEMIVDMYVGDPNNKKEKEEEFIKLVRELNEELA